jgi:hypothetical protein
VIPPELESRIKDVLGKMAMISEAPTSNLDPTTSHGAAEARVPAGVSERARIGRTDPGRPPSKERSLHDWFSWQFVRAATEPHRLIGLILLAERELMERTVFEARRIGLRKGELTDNDIADGGAAEREAAKRVVELYEGVPALEVAIYEYAEEAWVKKARRQLGRNPHDGRPRPEFLDLDDKGRHEAVARLKAKGMGQVKAARRLGVAKDTVQRYWAK